MKNKEDTISIIENIKASAKIEEKKKEIESLESELDNLRNIKHQFMEENHIIIQNKINEIKQDKEYSEWMKEFGIIQGALGNEFLERTPKINSLFQYFNNLIKNNNYEK